MEKNYIMKKKFDESFDRSQSLEAQGFEDIVSPAGLLATRELSTPLQIAEQSSTTVTHFEQTSSLADARHRSSQNPEPLALTAFAGGQNINAL